MRFQTDEFEEKLREKLMEQSISNNQIVAETEDFYIHALREVLCPRCRLRLETYKGSWYCPNCEKEISFGVEEVSLFKILKPENELMTPEEYIDR